MSLINGRSQVTESTTSVLDPLEMGPKREHAFQESQPLAEVESVAMERARGEEALRRSEIYLAEAQRLSHTGSFGWNVSSGELTWSEETFRILGYDRSLKPDVELVLQRVHPEDAVLVRRMIDVVSHQETSLDFEHRLLMPNRSVKHVHVIAHAVRCQSGAVEFVGAVMDVTERKRAEALVAGEKRLLEMIARGAALELVLDALCRFGEEVSDDVLVSILLVSPDGKSLSHGAAPSLPRSYTEAVDGSLVGPRAGSCGTAAYRGKPVMVSDIATDPLWAPYRHLALPHGLKACWSTPIFSTAREVMGTFALYSREPGRPTPQHKNLIEQMTHLAAVAIEREQSGEALRVSHESRQAAVMAERDRMARDIHDTLAQGFTGVIMQLEAAEEAMSQRLEAKTVEHVSRAGELAREGLREARRSVKALRPQALDGKNLCEALRDLIQRMTAGTSVRAEFNARCEPLGLPPAWEADLLRIGQEVLTNVLRHAHASHFKVELTFDQGKIRLDLGDNGSGFDPHGRHEGFGLQGMRQRVEGMGGQLTIESALGKGTAISIVVPLANTAEALAS